MKKTFRAHPLMTVRLMRPFLFVLVLPVVKGAIQYLMYRTVSGVLQLEALAFGIILAVAFLKSYFYTVTLDDGLLIIKNGIFFRSKSVIKISRLSSVKVTRNIVDFIFGSASCFINTEAGRNGGTDFTCKLSRRAAKMLMEDIYSEDKSKAITFSPVKISLMAATTSSAVTGLIVGVPIINNIGRLLGVGISDMLIAEINAVSKEIKTYFPPIVNVITIIFILGYLISFLISFLKLVKFRVFIAKDRIEVRSGLFVTRRTAFKKRAVNDVCVEQTPLMRLFGLYSMRASVAGYGNRKDEKASVMPCGTKREINRHLGIYFPKFGSLGAKLGAPQTAWESWRFVWLAFTYGVIIIGVTALSMIFFPYFDRLILFVGLVFLGIDFYYGNLCAFGHKRGRLSMSDGICAKSAHGFIWRELYCEKEKLGVITLITTPTDRRCKTCKVKLTVRSESTDSICVRNLPVEKVKKQIKNCFDIDV